MPATRSVRFLRAPGFTAVAVITLALGTGATAVIFSAVDALLLRDPPVTEPDRLVSVYTLFPARATTNPNAGDQVGGSSYPDYVDLRDSGVLDALAAYASVPLSLDADGTIERIDGQIVSGNYFDLLGVRAVVGRTFAADEDRRGSPVRVAVLSYQSWQQRFGGDAGLVGRTVALNGHDYTVIGVAPRDLSGVELGDAPEVWVPMALQEEVRPPSASSSSDSSSVWRAPPSARASFRAGSSRSSGRTRSPGSWS